MISLALASRLRGNCQHRLSHIINRYDVDARLGVTADHTPATSEETKNLVEWRELVDCACMRIPDHDAGSEDSDAARQFRASQQLFSLITCQFPAIMKTLSALQIEFAKQPSSATRDARGR